MSGELLRHKRVIAKSFECITSMKILSMLDFGGVKM
jgi:hypothetical protein